jgi:hypothetical protein
MGKGSILLVLTAVLGLGATTPGGALASSGDLAATQVYLQANYAVVKVARANLATSEAAPLRLLAQVRRECPLAGAGSPQDSESTQMSDEVIGAMVIAAYDPNHQAITAFTRSVAALRWSNSGLTQAIRRYVANLRTLLSLSAPNLCGDVKAWAASGYHTLPASTVAFVGKFMPAWVALGYVPAQLNPFETSGGKALARLAGGLEQQLTEGEARAVEHWGEIMNALVLNP